MDSIPSSPIKIQNATRCDQLQEDPTLQGLERFWNQEILHRLHEPQHHYCSSSLEKQFLYDDYLTNPIRAEERKERKIHRQNKSEQRRVVRGEELNDIPTTYLISGLLPHEHPVIGTYVDSAVLPGFRYKVRLNQTKKHLFGGHALRLLSVGPGYGKRLTFQGESALNNLNYFWSDSHTEGYGFALEVVSKGDKFVVKDPIDGCTKGIAEVVRFSTPQYELQSSVMRDGSVNKTVVIDVWCEYLDNESKSVIEVRIEGVAVVVKPKGAGSVAEVKGISVQRNKLQGLELFPIAC